MGISKGITEIPYFDVETFKETEWYFWEISGNIKILYVMVGVLGPLGLKWVYDRICSLVNDKIEKKESISVQTVKTLKLVSRLIFVIIFALFVSLIVLITKPKEDASEQYSLELTDEALTDIGEQGGYEQNLQDHNGNSNDKAQDSKHSTDNTDNNQTDNNDKTDLNSDNDPDSNRDDITPVYAYLDLAYDYKGTETDYLTGPYAINGNGTYTVTINRGDTAETKLAFDGLSYMGIRLLDDEMSDVDISKAVISDVKIKCDGIMLKVDETGSTPYEDGVIYNFFDCYDPDKNVTETYVFKNKNVIEISFTISGTKLKS